MPTIAGETFIQQSVDQRTPCFYALFSKTFAGCGVTRLSRIAE